MTPTPRTDAIAHRGYNEAAYIAEMTDLARQMERELAEANAISDTDTPRTDAEANRGNPYDGEMIVVEAGKAVPADFARQLERELAAAKDGWMDEICKAQSDMRNAEVLLNEAREQLTAEREQFAKRLDSSERARRSLSDAADYLNARLTAERALADRLARELEWVGSEAGGYANQLASEALAEWKEARREP